MINAIMNSIIHQGLQLNAVIDPETGAALEYRHLIQDFTTKILGRRQFIGFKQIINCYATQSMY